MVVVVNQYTVTFLNIRKLAQWQDIHDQIKTYENILYSSTVQNLQVIFNLSQITSYVAGPILAFSCHIHNAFHVLCFSLFYVDTFKIFPLLVTDYFEQYSVACWSCPIIRENSWLHSAKKLQEVGTYRPPFCEHLILPLSPFFESI